MISLGTSPAFAATGLALKDNGCCIIHGDFELTCVSSERISRTKHDSDFEPALQAALRNVGTDVASLNCVNVSTCSDRVGDALALPGFDRTFYVPHHYSHALSAYYFSGFEDCLVFVADAGGNVLSGTRSERWWQLPREQTSVWIGHGGSLQLIDYIHIDSLAVGFGELFRAATYYCGWPSHTFAGNLMALAGYGTPERLSKSPLFDLINSRQIHLRNNPKAPKEIIRSMLSQIGAAAPVKKNERKAFCQDLAAYVQRSYELEIIRLARHYARRYQCGAICLSGGVAQNCVANNKLVEALPELLWYFSPFAGDVGQCVGNALCGRNDWSSRVRDPIPYWGPRPDTNKQGSFSGPGSRVGPHAIKDAAELLAKGRVLAIFEGRSEFGPRALGHRSVLCDPTNAATVQRVKVGVKVREEFMPLAPVILPEVQSEFPVTAKLTKTMSTAPTVPECLRSELGRCVHVDGSARVQVATDQAHSMFEVLLAFQHLTGRRALVNTSLNRRGDPIVETEAQALSAFHQLEIDALLIEGTLIQKQV